MDLSHSIQPSLLTTFQLKHCGCCERCEKQIVAAEREFGAFVMAVHILFGKAEAAHAAECWIELVEEDKTSFADGFPNWRQVTVAAASRLSQEHLLITKRKVEERRMEDNRLFRRNDALNF